jgi:hypothetical protein
VATLVGNVELNEPVPVDVNVDGFDVDMGAKLSVAAYDKGITVGLEADVGTTVHKAKRGERSKY